MILRIKNQDLILHFIFIFNADDKAEETLLKFIEKIKVVPGHEE